MNDLKDNSKERHVSEVSRKPSFLSKKAGISVIIAGGAILCGVILLTSEIPNLKTEQLPPLPENSTTPYIPPPPPVLPSAEQPIIKTLVEPNRETKLLVYTENMAAGSENTDSLNETSTDIPKVNNLESRKQKTLMNHLETPPVVAVSASVLQRQSFLLTMGTMIPCILQTAIDSTLPGLVTCVIPQDIQGKTGLTLLDRGTKVVGEFRGDVRQGIERLFVAWTRAETPQGVIINLDSPATDPLGRSGMEGAIDRHFWQRFGGALLLTTVDGVFQAGTAAMSKEGTTIVNSGTTESVISESLRGSINIPPTIRKNQGELVSILVARDMDFSTVYHLQQKRPMHDKTTKIKRISRQ